MIRKAVVVLACILAAACRGDPPNAILGTLEWDRIELRAEASETVRAVDVREGDHVHAGQRLLALDPHRIDLELAHARADARRIQAQLDELIAGPRAERLREARALHAGAASAERDARRERDRIATLREQGLITAADLDQAQARLEQAAARRQASLAVLDELLSGTRGEVLRQAEAALAAAEAQLQLLEFRRERLQVRAPRDGRVDALPFRSGDQPPTGAVVVAMLVGEAPHARVFVPERMRPGLAAGSTATVALESADRSFRARLRWIASDPSFTPYFALSGDERARLVYLAEYELIDDDLQGLPAGLALRLTPDLP